MVSNTKTDLLQVITTTETRDDAEKIAHFLVKEKLAACAQVSGPITSFYWWQGQIESSGEWVCKAKTLRGKYIEIEKAVRKIHPYEVPQIIALPVTGVLEDYAMWVKESIGS